MLPVALLLRAVAALRSRGYPLAHESGAPQQNEIDGIVLWK